MDNHIETIQCPQCDNIQEAAMEHTLPWPTYIHTCNDCEYIIMESEWNKVDD
jgi:phage FluMu protein Com